MLLNKVNKTSTKYIELSTLLSEMNFSLESFLNIIEFNFLLNPDIYFSDFDINNFINETYDLLENLKNKIIPQEYSNVLLSNLDIRNIIISLQGFSLVSNDWLKPFAHWIGNRKVLEIMSGVGVLSSGLRTEGIDLISTDDYTATNFDFSTLWTDIEQLDALTSIEKYGKDIDIIIMSWCYTDETGYNCLLKMREINPNAVMIYIGEGPGMSTGSNSLYKNMIQMTDHAIEEINKIYPTWDGVSDRLYLIK